EALHVARATAEQYLRQYREFLDTLETPRFDSAQKRRRFLAKATEFFTQEGNMFRRRPNQPPQKVIFEPEERLRILTEAHD
ncbi:hypothetical protein K523DRAFT_189019, partial [Schizophyllum commune Tattone D]